MKTLMRCLTLAALLAYLGSGLLPGASAAASTAPALAPGDYPPDPTTDIDWLPGTSGVAAVQAAFNNARHQENAQLGLSLPDLSLPAQAAWDGMSVNARALWLINRERVDRGLLPLAGTESNVTGVAQTYAQYLLDNNHFSHYDLTGRSPWDRLAANPAIGACHDWLGVAENLAAFMSSADNIALPVERALYNWLYDDAGSGWGHRRAILYYPYADNSGTAGAEGFVGIGYVHGTNYSIFGSTWAYADIVVMNVFDPCASWVTPPPPGQNHQLFLPFVAKTLAQPPAAAGRLVVFEAFLSTACGNSLQAGPILDDLAYTYRNDPVVFLEYNVDGNSLREYKWWFAHNFGQAYLPLAMVDSGHQWTEGPVNYRAVYAQMVQAGLARAPRAELAATSQLKVNYFQFTVSLTNRAGVTLGPANDATLWAIVYEIMPDSGLATGHLTRRFVRVESYQTIDQDLPDGSARTFIFNTPTLASVENWDNLRAIILLDYLPAGASTYDTLQAAFSQ